MRGNHAVRRPRLPRAGSIPACAGEPANEIFGRGNWGVYPRVCGGTAGEMLDVLSREGLSPRVRGNLAPDETWWASLRSIPACAGEPTGRHKRDGTYAVYPRVCGGT